jgi:transmembrane sensor
MSPAGKRRTAVDRRRQSAARWFVALQNGVPSPRLLRSWERWNGVADNRRAFDELLHLWRRLDESPRPLSPSPAELADDDYDGSSSVADWRARSTATHALYRWLRIGSGVIGIAAAFALVVIGGMILLSTYLAPLRSLAPMTVYETGRAEHRRVVLGDGTRIDLGAQSALTANITPYARTVVLDRGEALFHVARDPGRPFRVLAGRGTITAVGTTFNVRRWDEGSVVVTVTEGTIEVGPELQGSDPLTRSATTTAPGEVRRLDRGQQIRYDASGRFGRVESADTRTSLGWREGRLSYAGEPLRRVVLDVNRYSRREIAIGDVDAGELLYSGTVFESEIDDWIVGLERLFPTIEVVANDAQHVLIHTRDREGAAPLTDRRESLSIPRD